MYTELFTYSDGSGLEIDIVDSQALVSEFEVPSAGERRSRLALLLFAHLLSAQLS